MPLTKQVRGHAPNTPVPAAAKAARGFAFILPALLLCFLSCPAAPASGPAAPLKVVSFNLLRFGDAKAADRKIAGFMASLIRDADVAALQEGLDLSEDAARGFAEMAGADKAFVLGPPQGRNDFYRENYLFLYNKNRVSLAAAAVYPDIERTFERPPMAAYFKAAAFDFFIVNCHVKPDETAARTTAEIARLPGVVRYFSALWRETDALVAGDLNAAGAYYDEDSLAYVFPQAAWTIVTPNGCDTTVSPKNTFAYDRLIISKSAAEDWTGNWGIIRFDSWDECRNVTPNPMADISDHYPLWADFFVTNDSD